MCTCVSVRLCSILCCVCLSVSGLEARSERASAREAQRNSSCHSICRSKGVKVFPQRYTEVIKRHTLTHFSHKCTKTNRQKHTQNTRKNIYSLLTDDCTLGREINKTSGILPGAQQRVFMYVWIFFYIFASVDLYLCSQG